MTDQINYTELENKSTDAARQDTPVNLTKLRELSVETSFAGNNPSSSPLGKRSARGRGAEKKKLGVGSVIGRILSVVAAAILLTVFALLSMIFVLERGPSPTAKRLFVLSVKETSAAGFLANIFLPGSEVDAIVEAQAASASGSDDITDSTLIDIPQHSETNAPGAETEAPAAETYKQEQSGEQYGTVSSDNGIEVIQIKKSTFNGAAIRISDPSRVFLGTPTSYGEDSVGLTLRQMVSESGAVGGINGGGFYDPNGSGTGGIPDGLVIKDGKLLWGNEGSSYNVIGFDGNGILQVGNMTASHALEIGVKYACSFGPTLIINGVPCNKGGDLGGGMNPRTAIGQCSDGSVLFVVINGRSLGSLGATYDDLTDIMIEFGAVNAANLDGGSSSLLMYKGEFLNTSASVIGERELPTAFLVK